MIRTTARRVTAQVRRGLDAKVRYGAGQAAIAALVAVLLLTAWVTLMIGLVLFLANVWGTGVALAAFCAANVVAALLLVLVLRNRTERERQAAARRRDAMLRAALPVDLLTARQLLRHKETIAAVGGGLVTAWAILSVLSPRGADRDPGRNPSSKQFSKGGKDDASNQT